MTPPDAPPAATGRRRLSDRQQRGLSESDPTGTSGDAGANPAYDVGAWGNRAAHARGQTEEAAGGGGGGGGGARKSASGRAERLGDAPGAGLMPTVFGTAYAVLVHGREYDDKRLVDESALYRLKGECGRVGAGGGRCGRVWAGVGGCGSV